MVVCLEIEVWVIGKGGIKKVLEKGGRWGKRYGVSWVLWPLCVVEFISVVLVEGDCFRDCRGWGVCTVGTVG
jgi:hypothetical protein